MGPLAPRASQAIRSLVRSQTLLLAVLAVAGCDGGLAPAGETPATAQAPAAPALDHQRGEVLVILDERSPGALAEQAAAGLMDDAGLERRASRLDAAKE